MMKNGGITDTNKQLLITAINPIFSLLGSLYGCTLLDKLGRRQMLMWGLIGSLIFYALLTAFTAQSEIHPNMVYGTIVSIYCFGICFSWGLTPLQTLYAVECLESRTRAKGSGLNFLVLNVAMVVNTYGISVGIEVIKWRLYLVYIVWIVIELLIIYFFFVETAGKVRLLLTPTTDPPANQSLDSGGAVRDIRGQEPEKGQHGEDEGSHGRVRPCAQCRILDRRVPYRCLCKSAYHENRLRCIRQICNRCIGRGSGLGTPTGRGRINWLLSIDRNTTDV